MKLNHPFINGDIFVCYDNLERKKIWLLMSNSAILMSFWRKLEEEHFETWKEVQNKSWKLEKKNGREEVQSRVISDIKLKVM